MRKILRWSAAQCRRSMLHKVKNTPGPVAATCRHRAAPCVPLHQWTAAKRKKREEQDDEIQKLSLRARPQRHYMQGCSSKFRVLHQWTLTAELCWCWGVAVVSSCSTSRSPNSIGQQGPCWTWHPSAMLSAVALGPQPAPRQPARPHARLLHRGAPG